MLDGSAYDSARRVHGRLVVYDDRGAAEQAGAVFAEAFCPGVVITNAREPSRAVSGARSFSAPARKTTREGNVSWMKRRFMNGTRW